MPTQKPQPIPKISKQTLQNHIGVITTATLGSKTRLCSRSTRATNQLIKNFRTEVQMAADQGAVTPVEAAILEEQYYRALLSTAHPDHGPERAMLSAFVRDAVARQGISQAELDFWDMGERSG